MGRTEFIADIQIYERVIQEEIPKARDFLWIGTSDLKDMYVRKKGRMVPFLEVLSDLIKRKDKNSIKRIAFVLYASKVDTYARDLPAIQSTAVVACKLALKRPAMVYSTNFVISKTSGCLKAPTTILPAQAGLFVSASPVDPYVGEETHPFLACGVGRDGRI